jgi:mono/diheme cytochrome c family protein
MALRLTRVAVCLAFAVGGCDSAAASSARTAGNALRGEQLIRSRGCAACHIIPGIRAPHGLVAPGLDAFASRAYIAGVLPNTPSNLVRWVMDPPAVSPETAMPALGLSQAQAQDVAAYLYTLD